MGKPEKADVIITEYQSCASLMIQCLNDAGIADYLTSIDVDLDKEWEPCLQFYMHEAEILIQIIKVVIFTFSVNGTQLQFPFPILDWLQCLAVLDNGENADQPLINRVIL